MSDRAAFAALVKRSGLRQVALARLTGREDRRTVWRWCRGHTEVPANARTIVRQQLRIRALAEALAGPG